MVTYAADLPGAEKVMFKGNPQLRTYVIYAKLLSHNVT